MLKLGLGTFIACCMMVAMGCVDLPPPPPSGNHLSILPQHGQKKSKVTTTVDCSTKVFELVDCMLYLGSGSGNSPTPTQQCCSAFKSMVSTAPQCICYAINAAPKLGFSFNLTKVAALPSFCKVTAPPLSVCNVTVSPQPSPIPSPEPSPVPPANPPSNNHSVAPPPTVPTLAPPVGAPPPTVPTLAPPVGAPPLTSPTPMPAPPETSPVEAPPKSSPSPPATTPNPPATPIPTPPTTLPAQPPSKSSPPPAAPSATVPAPPVGEPTTSSDQTPAQSPSSDSTVMHVSLASLIMVVSSFLAI